MPMLEIDSVVAGYGAGPPILTGVSVEIEADRSYCIIGPNGAGKSTLLKVVCGILRPRAGEIRLNGNRVSGLRPDQLLAQGVCFVPQDQSLFAAMTVRENLTMGAFLIRERTVVQERMARVFEMFPVLQERSGQLAGAADGCPGKGPHDGTEAPHDR
jgi:branched-chain amino acid transport system ATP-binding protein